MKIKYPHPAALINKSSLFVLGVFMFAGVLSVLPSKTGLTGVASAACLPTAPPTTYGQVTQTVNVVTAGTYRVWSRIKAPDTTANSYYFQADGGCAYNVGDAAAIPANAWTWVNYQDSATASVINVTLTAGSHTLTYTGKEANVQLDKVMLLTDTNCVPTGDGANCAVNDVDGPVTSITAPAPSSTVSGTVNITANATDVSGVAKVEFVIDNVTVGTDTTAAYSYSWNTTTATNGNHNIQVKATDTAGNVTVLSPIIVTVANPIVDPTPPTGVTITAPTNGTTVTAGAAVNITGVALDNIGVVKMEFLVDGVVKSTDTTPPAPWTYTWDTTGVAAGVHSLTIKAYDAANNSTVSPAAVSVTVGAVAPGNGDVNLDGHVNAIDLSSVITHDGQNFPAADFNHDGTVGAADMSIVIAKWTW